MKEQAMKAYHLDRFGSLDGIVMRRDPMPEPGAREAVVKIHARSLNYRDLSILHRLYPLPGTQGVIPLSDAIRVRQHFLRITYGAKSGDPRRIFQVITFEMVAVNISV